ncbi:hypothetical protein ASPSYDRAFT_59720 [Aspergillus sydowii CBS 593.65]|uniref:FAD-binding domain-containing protein n=1 Tax=Aspergillus sydowii CBS 593.65 TaxID=1036612 RepID=A0A1L9TAD6_9EURO|nr:uncharacterized protein ASPSYDRAFT_59720 [Aspergillus sydowii CBS 593.65]OJJ56400.1 hypothetical protein ASPSYDRAFT_59720 [Aspergillus sydowii CBS 593.65]
MVETSPTTPRVAVAIIGAGIGGLTLGAFLHRLGISFIILERAPVLTPQGAGISLAPNCLAALDQLGLYDKIKQNAQELHGIRVYRENNCWGTIDFGLAKRWFGYNVLSIERHEFHGYLYEAAGCEEVVNLGWNVANIENFEGDDGALRVLSDDGREVHADIVVGADGIRSVTRRILSRSIGLQPENTIRFTGRVHMSGYTQPLSHLSTDDLGIAHWMLYNDCILTTWPCKENRQWFIGVKAVARDAKNPDRSVWKGATPETVNAVYGDKFHPFGKDSSVEAIVNSSERVVASNVFEEADFPHMVRGRVALLGDAAHSMTSFFGQGACQAIEDATVLADSISLYLQAGDKAALDTYARVREKRAHDVASFSARYARLHTASWPGPVAGKVLRAIIYRMLPSAAWMWYLTWLYGFQPVSRRLDTVLKEQ